LIKNAPGAQEVQKSVCKKIMCAMVLAKRISAPPGVHFQCEFVKIPVSSLYIATENELQGIGMVFSKNATRAFKVTDFELIVCPPTSTLKLKVLMLKL
jgi:hypothetical protein